MFKKKSPKELESKRIEIKYKWLLENGYDEYTAKRILGINKLIN